MSKKHNSYNPFSMIADFDGDIRELFEVEHKGTLPVLPLRNMVLFPGVIAPVSVARESSKELIKWAQTHGPETFIAVAAQVDPNIEQPTLVDLFPVATLAKIMKVMEMPDGKLNVILQAFGRVELNPVSYRNTPFIRTGATHLSEVLPNVTDRDWQALYDSFREATMEYLDANEHVGPEAIFAIRNINNPFYFVHYVATNLPVDVDEKALLLDEKNFTDRTLQALRLIHRELRYIELRNKIQEKTRGDLDKQQREYFLQQQMRNIQVELGNAENADSVVLMTKVEKLELPKAVRELFEREIHKLERQNPASPDYNVILSYLETIVSLPWPKKGETTVLPEIKIDTARKILNRDHYGMEKVKERILEHLAYMRYSRERRSPILCLYGPPGVGKTSLGRSIAESLGRKYIRVSLGGLHDESEIRGHRRTYIGAMCGRIMKNIIKCGTTTPVFILDEIDKVSGMTHNGDPQSALLELLDPEQNDSFHDNYLDFDFDLSKVFFIATANNISEIPPALRDRMEFIEVEGYTAEEKQEILKRHLLPAIKKELTHECTIKLSKSATEFLIERYTRESGVRQLQKQLEKLVRRYLLDFSSDEFLDAAQRAKSLQPKDIERYLGVPRYSRDVYQDNQTAGVVTGLAWTAVGGDILFIETSLSPSKSPRLTLTGNLGDVMKESATLALEYVKAHVDALAIDRRVFEQYSIHVHVPEGATPKDGPSAGITIATSIASALTQRQVRPRTAMTGEITLRGKVLPVGGIKEKILAAKRAGITDIILSEENRKDIGEIPAAYIEKLTFHFVTKVAEVWDTALLPHLAPDHIKITLTDNEQ